MKSRGARSLMFACILVAGTLPYAAAQELRPIIVAPADLINTIVAPGGMCTRSLDVMNTATGDVILAASAWRLGTPNFAGEAIDRIDDNPSSVYSADLDGDGDVDAVSTAFYSDSVTWSENRGPGVPWLAHRIASGFDGAQGVCAADFDGDGDADVLAVAYYGNQVSWWENARGDGSSWVLHVVDRTFLLPHEVTAADMDGDGDADILGAEAGANKVAWFENARGDGSLWVKHVAASLPGVRSVAAADFDSDGDLDVGAVNGAGAVRWEENLDGRGTRWREHLVDDGMRGAYVVTAADFNGDGHPDLVAAVYGLNAVAWWENPGGGGSWAKHVIDPCSSGPRTVCAADLDGDGDMDALGAAWWTEDVVWYENMDGSGAQWRTHVLDRTAIGGCSLHVADMDGDGDPDILGALAYADEVRLWRSDMAPCWLRVEPTASDVAAGAHVELRATFDATDLIEGDHAEGRILLTHAAAGTVAAAVPVSLDVMLDTNGPSTSCSISPPANDWGWHKEEVTVVLTSEDMESGVRDIHYALDGAWTVVPGDEHEFVVADEGIHALAYFAVDDAGNLEAPHDNDIRLDKTAPDLELQLVSKRKGNSRKDRVVELRFAATDNLSGVRELQAGLLLPDLGRYRYRLWQNHNLFRIVVDQRKRLIEIRADNPGAVLEQIRTGLLSIECGQRLDLKTLPHDRRWIIQRTGQTLKVTAPAVVFEATAIDYADNAAVAELSASDAATPRGRSVQRPSGKQ